MAREAAATKDAVFAEQESSKKLKEALSQVSVLKAQHEKQELAVA